MSSPDRFDSFSQPPRRVQVVIDSPRFSFTKLHDDGRIDFVSPLPCPFNYGSVPDTYSGDGDRMDALVLGPRLPRGARVERSVVAIVRFVDAGLQDPKWVCSQQPLSARDARELRAFFVAYALAKRALNALRGQGGATRYEGLDRVP